MLNKDIKKVIFVDELEAIISTDKLIVSELMNIINEHNIKKRGRSKKKKINRNSNPLIIVSHDIKNKKVKEMMNDCDVINLRPIVDFQLYNFIKSILDKENINISDIQIYSIINKCCGDLRKIYEIIQNIIFGHGKIKNNDNYNIGKNELEKNKNKEDKEKNKNKEEEAKNEVIDIDIDICEKKEIDLSLNSILDILYRRNNLTPNDIIYYFDHDKVNIPLMYYENNLQYIESFKENYLEDTMKIYEHFSNSNVIESYIFNDQKWQLNDYFCNESISIPRNIIKNMNNRKSPKPFFVKFSIVLSKTSLRYYNIKILKNLADQMGIYIDDFYDTISYLIMLLKQKKYDNIEQFLLLYHLEHSDFEKMLKLYYSTSDLPNEIKTGLKNMSII
tara:strand:- start:599 stop:1768 length:1170 start_codon:yes stop_codon:yes gene_type:complete